MGNKQYNPSENKASWWYRQNRVANSWWKFRSDMTMPIIVTVKTSMNEDTVTLRIHRYRDEVNKLKEIILWIIVSIVITNDDDQRRLLWRITISLLSPYSEHQTNHRHDTKNHQVEDAHKIDFICCCWALRRKIATRWSIVFENEAHLRCIMNWIWITRLQN